MIWAPTWLTPVPSTMVSGPWPGELVQTSSSPIVKLPFQLVLSTAVKPVPPPLKLPVMPIPPADVAVNGSGIVVLSGPNCVQFNVSLPVLVVTREITPACVTAAVAKATAINKSVFFISSSKLKYQGSGQATRLILVAYMQPGNFMEATRVLQSKVQIGRAS